MEKYAVYCGNERVYEDMETCAKSLVANSDVDKIWFLTDGKYKRKVPEIIECVDVSSQKYFLKDGPNMKSHFSYMAMMRAALCHVFPDLGTILSLDADTICVRDVSRLWDIDLDGYYFSASHEHHRTSNGLLYCNTGVALYNLEKLRDGKADEVIEVLNTRKYTWVEQDVFNYLCQGRIHDMPSAYNSNWWTDRGKDPYPKIIHYAGKQRCEWGTENPVRLYRNMSWDEVMENHG